MRSASRFDRINHVALEPLVRRALEDPEVEIVKWDRNVLKGDWTSGKRLVCRIFGRGKRGDEEVPWSLFLKVPNPTRTHLDSWHREPFQREPLLYQSGILDDLPGGIAAPRCLGVTECPDDEPWMWLEDVRGEPSLEWPLERFGATARHFGLMQGAFLAGAPLPDHAWLDTSDWLRTQLAAGAERVPPILESFGRHPLAGRLYGSIGKRLERLWAERGVFFTVMEHMPRSLCHGDFNYTNLFARGDDETAVVDWQYAGVRQIGGDIGGFIADSSVIPVRRKAAEPEEFTELMLDGYLSGLREAGWKGDLRIPRFACVARLALPWSFNLALSLDGGVLRHTLSGENRTRLEEKLDEYVRRQEFLFELAKEARALLEAIR